jgi:hypothetical protein
MGEVGKCDKAGNCSASRGVRCMHARLASGSPPASISGRTAARDIWSVSSGSKHHLYLGSKAIK